MLMVEICVHHWHLWLFLLLVKLGVPRLVRADQGTENTLVEDVQVALRWQHEDDMAGTKSFLYGKSTSNQVCHCLFCYSSILSVKAPLKTLIAIIFSIYVGLFFGAAWLILFWCRCPMKPLPDRYFPVILILLDNADGFRHCYKIPYFIFRQHYFFRSLNWNNIIKCKMWNTQFHLIHVEQCSQ